MPSKAEDREIRKREFSLMIDHRLGTEFPEDKRDALWRVHQEIERRRIRLAARYLFSRIGFTGRAKRAHSLAEFMVDEYAKVLGRREAELFFGLEKGESPALPIDLNR